MIHLCFNSRDAVLIKRYNIVVGDMLRVTMRRRGEMGEMIALRCVIIYASFALKQRWLGLTKCIHYVRYVMYRCDFFGHFSDFEHPMDLGEGRMQ